MARKTRSSAGKAATESKPIKKEPQQLSSPPATPTSRASRTKTQVDTPAPKATNGRKRSRKTATSNEYDDNELPHNLGAALPTPGKQANPEDSNSAEPPKKRSRRSGPGPKAHVKEEVTDRKIKDEPTEDTPIERKPTPKKPKKENYGLTPGISPYSDYPHPTPEECREVVRLLEKVHGKVDAPKAIPPPSLEVAGCGEVPSVLDALVRTRLSANTTNKNSSTAFQGLVKRFGTLSEGIGKGSVDWDAVRRAPQKEVFKAIERGGLADRKSKDIQAILQIAYEDNQARKTALTDSKDGPEGAEIEAENEKNQEIEKASQNIISLDHYHLLSTDDAINKMLELPGIGPKTASCVALFCLQRPSFAVDTHVFRLCQYLGWVPKSVKKGQPKVDRNTTYSHCDARIPDEYKYKLHYLLIKHGKTCPRCRAVTGQSSAGWDEGCPIEHLVKRHGTKKGGMSAADRKKAKDAANTETTNDASADVADETSDLSDGET